MAARSAVTPRTLATRSSRAAISREFDLAGKRLFFLFRGGAPTQQMYERGEYTINRFAGLYGMDYMGMARNASEARALAAKL